jgi:hypothetical protein
VECGREGIEGEEIKKFVGVCDHQSPPAGNRRRASRQNVSSSASGKCASAVP